MAEDVTKLPRWAQWRIDRLERDAAYWREKALAPDVGAGTRVAISYGGREDERPLVDDARVVFRFPTHSPSWRREITVSLRDDRLLVMGGDGLLVMPASSNVVEIAPYHPGKDLDAFLAGDTVPATLTLDPPETGKRG